MRKLSICLLKLREYRFKYYFDPYTVNLVHFRSSAFETSILVHVLLKFDYNGHFLGKNTNEKIVMHPCSKLCVEGSLDPRKVKGKIIVCVRGDDARVNKGFVAAKAGAVGMILANNEKYGNDVVVDAHILPVSHISYIDGETVYKYINSTK